jgi:hypothetical protein
MKNNVCIHAKDCRKCLCSNCKSVTLCDSCNRDEGPTLKGECSTFLKRHSIITKFSKNLIYSFNVWRISK